jgi:hypothetical protein
MSLAVNRWLVYADARFRFQASPRVIFDVGIGTGRDISLASSVFVFQYHAASAPYLLARLSPTLFNLNN